MFFNGINGSRGTYLSPPQTPEVIARLAQGESLDPAHLAELKGRHRRETEMTFGTIAGVDPRDLASAGWGVIFPTDLNAAVRDAIGKLLEHRKAQAARERPNRYQEYAGYKGYRPGESKRAFLTRQGAAAGMPADPDRVPYYLLLVGSPEAISYQFQYQLDVEYAVGRLWFEKPDGSPDLEAFARYAQSVVDLDTGAVPPLPRRAALFGVRNSDDPATQLSADFLVRPLAQQVTGPAAGWEFVTRLQDQARKHDLASLLGGADTPTLLFTASHGMGFDPDDTRQFPHQGALLCQDWPGPRQWGEQSIPADFYFAADDVPDSARLLGLICFHFACYGLGTPRLDDFPHLKRLAERPQIAPRPFVARLPQRLLGHPNGGALAVVGHVERAWSCSFHGGTRLGSQLQAFQSTLFDILEGAPVGFALEYFNQLYAALSTELSAELEDIKYGKTPDNLELSNVWTANNDARSYLVFGDPAVRLVVGANGQSGPRPVVEKVSLPTSLTKSLEAGPPSAATVVSNVRPREARADKATATVTIPLRLQVDKPGGESSSLDLPLQVTVSVEVPSGPATAEATAAPAPAAEAPTAFEAISIDPDYSNREGYDPEFLGGEDLRVELPKLSADLRSVAARLQDVEPGEDPFELKYHHFSVVLHRTRRLAIFTAVNIDGRLPKTIERSRDKWIFDPRVSAGAQVGNELYGRPFDRGHLVRRLDPAWGRTTRVAKVANDDTFHFTNCSPQHYRFNEGKNLWAGLEDYLLQKAAGERKRLSVFTGPVFEDNDPEYRGVRIPKRFWKIAFLARPGQRLAALGFLVSQEDLLRDFISFGPEDVARLFQTPVRHLETATGLSFGPLADADLGSIVDFAPGASPLKELKSLEDIALPG
jgi:DNA/RNA endonuclease G (NUC1)